MISPTLYLSLQRDLTWPSSYAASSPEIEQKGWNGVYLTDPVSDIGAHPVSYLMILGKTRKGELASQGSRTRRCTVEAERGTGQRKAWRRRTGGLAFLLMSSS